MKVQLIKHPEQYLIHGEHSMNLREDGSGVLVAGVCVREVSEIARACWAVGHDGSYQEICDELNDPHFQDFCLC